VAELRAEREERERTERTKAAALLQVPLWAAAHPHSVTQRDMRDDKPPSSSQAARRDAFQGRHFSEFAFNRRS